VPRERCAVRWATVSEPHVHTETHRIVMSEVDVAQIHFVTFSRWIDRSLSEWLAEIGMPFTRLLEVGPGIPIVDSHLSIRRRVMLDDIITIRTWVGDIGRTSFRSLHEFTRDGDLVAEAQLVHVCVDRATREPVPVPEWIRAVAASADS
jgi:YbgC/YbaW family acyl-CoA thioester hydrolase